MSSPEISGQGGASSDSLFGLSSQQKKKKIVCHWFCRRPAVTYHTWIFSIPIWDPASDPLSVAVQSWFFEHQMFFFLLRYDVAEYCIVLYKTRLQRCNGS